jgi:hypothetical protein
MPGQRKSGKVLIGYYDWESNKKLIANLAKIENIPQSTILKRAITEYLKKKGKKPKIN